MTSLSIERKIDALIVVDVQNDFCPGGTLPVKEGDLIIPIINGLEKKFNHTFFTRDWHPVDHFSFSEKPEFVDKSWPAHCVAETAGADFHPDLSVPESAILIYKGTDREIEAYSGFQGTDLNIQLRNRGVKRLFVCGLATDYCVKNTVLDGLKNNFDVCCVIDACRGVNVPEGTAEVATDEMRKAGAKIVASTELS